MSFSVDKWYLDLVTSDGVVVIGYAIEVRWLGLDLRMASRLVARPGERSEVRTLVGEHTPVRDEDGDLVWTADALGLRASWRPDAAPFGRTLLDAPEGRIEWTCAMPRARATAVTATATHDGLGYVEHIHLSVAPWSLPFHALRWGRHVSDRHSLVWIEWDDGRALRAVWLDGQPQPSARAETAGVSGLSGRWALQWHEGRDLARRRIGALIEDAAPALAAPVAGRLARMQEHKQVAASSLVDGAGRPLDAGWTIHEVVTW